VVLSIAAFMGVYAYLADSLVLKHAAAAPPGASGAPGLPTGTRLAALPESENGTPVLGADAEVDRDLGSEPTNDLQRRVAAIRSRLGETVFGRSINDVTYVSMPDASRLVEAEWRWDKAQQAGVLITDEGLVRFAADSSRVSVNEASGRIPGPLRLVGGKPFLPLPALVALYGASVGSVGDTGLTAVTVRGKTFSVAVPERLFRIEICREGRWLKVSYAGQFAKEYPICSGAGDNTPVGHFHIQNKAEWPSWRAYWGELIPGGSPRNPLGARWLGTTARGRVTGWPIGIHGTNQPSSIGQRISGGCIRTYNHFSIELYETVPIGTPVWIHE
jgi:hypothetical protein